MCSGPKLDVSVDAVTPRASELDIVDCHAAPAPWLERRAADAARIAADRNKAEDGGLDDDHVVIILFVVERDAAVVALDFTHGDVPPARDC
jgi:hypothetical protein